VSFRFAVDEVFKGELGAEVDLRATSQGPACGPSFEADQRYLVYVNEQRGQPTSTSCSGNVADPSPELLERRFDIAAAPSPDVPSPEPILPDQGGFLWSAVAGLAVLGTVVGLGLWIWVMRPRRVPG
jgi:hypothetical protein